MECNLMNQALLKSIMALWEGDINSLKFISEGINLIYRFEVKGKGKILRVTHSTNRSHEELLAASDYQRHLFENNAPVGQPIKSIFFRYVEKINSGSEVLFARVVDEVPGQVMELQDTNKDLYRTWGNSLAKLHVAAKTYRPNRTFQFISWKDVWEEVYRYIQSEEQKIKSEYWTINNWFNDLSNDRDTYGLSHGDHRIGNVISDNKNIYIIDFDEPIYHWFIADIARPFIELCERSFCNWKEIFLWYLEGYQSILALDKKEFEYIPWFIRMKNLDMYLWTKNNWHHPIAPGGTPTDQWLHSRRKMIFEPLFVEWFPL
jgi:Ser/Thr protein kinase RdoA (MazF antagonist)